MSMLEGRRAEVRGEVRALRQMGATSVDVSPCGTFVTAWTSRDGKRHEERGPSFRPWSDELEAEAARRAPAPRTAPQGAEAFQAAAARTARVLEAVDAEKKRQAREELRKKNPIRARIEDLREQEASLQAEVDELNRRNAILLGRVAVEKPEAYERLVREQREAKARAAS